MDDIHYIIRSMKYKRNLLSTENAENVPDDVMNMMMMEVTKVPVQ